MFTVVLRRDPEGPCCALLRPDSEPLQHGPGITYRVVASTDDHAEALGVLVLVERAIRSGELRIEVGSR